MERERKGKAKRKLLVAFFALMMIFTAVSRIYDSFTVPKVLTSVTKRKGIETLVEGQGTVKVQEKAYYLPLPGLRIAQAALMPGSQVEEGQVLFKYDLASLKEQKEELERELKQLAFDIAKEEISQESVPGITQAELAFREWLLAGEELAQGQIKSAEAKEEYEREGQRLEQEYQDGMDQLEEELWQQQDADVEAARQNLESAKNSRNRELREAERKVEDLTEQLDRLSQEDEDAYREAERKLERAVEDLDDLKESWEEQIDSAKLQIEALESKEEWIRSGKMSAQESKRKAYEEQVKQQEEKLKAAKEAEEELEKAVEQAQWQLSAAQRQDETAAVSENQKKRISALNIRGLQLAQEKKRRQLNQLEELIGQEGMVRALQKGTVADMELLAGKTATGEERLSIALGEGRFEGTFIKEEQKLAEGDKIQITIPGTDKKKEAVINAINLFDETEGVFQADLSGQELPFGAVCSFTCRKQSDIFSKVIPLSGLRKDMEGYFCLVARSRASILGEEFVAERVNVELLYAGSSEAAIEGAVLPEDAVIVGENKSIGKGERVRPVSGF